MTINEQIKKFKIYELEYIRFKGKVLGQEYQARIRLLENNYTPILQLELLFRKDQNIAKNIWTTPVPYEVLQSQEVFKKSMFELIQEMANENIIVDIT